jgi:NDP-sugar pyrophosphorylase family protein
MQAIIFANRSATELAPLNRQYCAALLPVANKAIIDYTLEDLAQAGITRAKLVIANNAAEIESHVANGAKWNLTIEYFLSKPEEDIESVLKRMKLDPNQSLLVVRGDIVRTPCIRRFVEFAKQVKQAFVLASMSDLNPGLLMLPEGRLHGHNLNWPLAAPQKDNDKTINQVLHGMAFHLDSIDNFVAANHYIIKHADTFGLKGRRVDSAQKNNQLRIEHQTQHPSFANQKTYGNIGANTYLNNQVKCHGAIVIGQHCYIDNSELSNSIVLPNTYIGNNLSVSNQIVSQDYIIDIAKNTWVKVNDPSLVSTCHLKVKKLTKVSFITRLVAALLILLTLPIMLISLLVACIQRPKHPIKRICVSNNQQQLISLIEIAINAPVLAKLPQLWLVVKGELLLFGASSLGHQHARYGVFGPVQILLNDTTPQEEIELVEMEFQPLSQLGYLRRLWQITHSINAR